MNRFENSIDKIFLSLKMESFARVQSIIIPLLNERIHVHSHAW